MLKTIDLFAGAGGLSYGFQQTGKFKLVAAAEINKNAQATYKANIAKDDPNFIFIDNVLGYSFKELDEHVGGIDVVIGGPPCQGFSNANRQKNHLISMNNGLVKEYFRAIKEIRPKAFVMENVSMLRSDTHRFYESSKDNDEIEILRNAGFSIPTRMESIFIAKDLFTGVDLKCPDQLQASELLLPENLCKLISVLGKNLNNPHRLPTYLLKHADEIIKQTEKYISSIESPTAAQHSIIKNLNIIKIALESDSVQQASEAISNTVGLQKILSVIREIDENQLIGNYRFVEETDELFFDVKSYSVIDYINAILGDEYVQNGDTINAEWFGVPQERWRYIIIGVRNDMFTKEAIELPCVPENLVVRTVDEAISDLKPYEISYEATEVTTPYANETINQLSEYAVLMRTGSEGVTNHVTTKTTDVALERFKAIAPGKNFHSLESELKTTYSKPERTQRTIYMRLDPTKPSSTVVNVRKSMWIHPELDRAVTVREAARLQSFPDRFIFKGAKDSQFQQVGNAVPPLLAEAIAKKLIENIS